MGKELNKCVVAIIKNENDEILLEDHVKTGSWTMPGGKIDKGEDVNKALIRELFEELGILAYRYREYMQTLIEDIEYPVGSGNFSSFYQNYYVIDEYKGKIENKEPQKHLHLEWSKPEDIRSKYEKISPTLDTFLKSLGL